MSSTAGQTKAPAPDGDVQAVAKLKSAHAAIKSELAKTIVGQQQVIDEILIALFTRSHALLVGVPGLAKTLMISTLAQALHLSFKRIQFTPDLMPSDITGTEMIYQDPATGERRFKFLQGPIFANIILADEINRTPPKTAEALDFCNKWLTWAAGSCASLNLILTAKAHAILRGQFHVGVDDVQAVALSIFRHRIIPNFAAQS